MLPVSITVDQEWVRGTRSNTASSGELYQNSTYINKLWLTKSWWGATGSSGSSESESAGPAALKTCFWNLYKISK